MRFNVLLLTVLFASLLAVQVQADEDITILSEIGKHSVHPPLKTKEDLWKMMRTPKVLRDIKEALKRAECPGTKTGKCIDLVDHIRALFPADYDEFNEKKSEEIRDKLYPRDSVLFYWMMFRSEGKGKIKLSRKIKWGGYYSLPAYEFSIPYKDHIYRFAVPKECGNLALMKKICDKPCDCQKTCPDPCKDCPGPNCPAKCKVPVPCPDDCSGCSKECRENPDSKGCEPQCKQCKEQKCFTDCDPDIINQCEEKNCGECSDECVKNPQAEGCPSQCQECKDLKCLRIVEIPLCEKEKCGQCSEDCKLTGQCETAECKTCWDEECFVPVEKPCHDCFNIRFVGDVGYFRQSDPADYLFGRVGVEYSPFQKGSRFENISLLTMIGAAPKVGGSDGDSAFLLDLLAQYNWSEPFKGGFIGLGFGGWFTSSDAEDDSADSDLDFIANIGFKVLDEPDMSVFFEMRNAVDELDGIAEYGRFGAGLRSRF